MSTAKHTPGPWGFFEDDFEGGYTIDVPSFRRPFPEGDDPVSFRPIATVRDQQEVAANARLIAAAPELLAACKRAVPQIHDDESTSAAGVRRLLLAAIAKAEGGGA